MEELAEAALTGDEEKERKQSKRNLALFLSKKEEIIEALLAGWSRKSIWEFLHGQRAFEGSYDCFIRYVRKYIQPSLILTCTDVSTVPAPKNPVNRPSPLRGSPPGGNKFDFSATIDEKALYGEDVSKSLKTHKEGPHGHS